MIFNIELSGIYKIICKNNKKFYIGSSINIDRRLKDHVRLLKRNKHKNKYLQNCWNKYGEQNFRFEIIETIYGVEQLPIREKWWIDNTDCCNRKIGFNVSSEPLTPGIERFIDLTGKKFNKLTIAKYVGKNRYGQSLWKCLCDCGKDKIVTSGNFKSGNTQSCGCLCVGGNRLKHGLAKTGSVSKIYKIWSNMIQRCNNPKNRNYHNYGGMGIKVCKRWIKFENFYEDVGDPLKELILDRININGNYEPNNWKWSTRKEQNINKKCKGI